MLLSMNEYKNRGQHSFFLKPFLFKIIHWVINLHNILFTRNYPLKRNVLSIYFAFSWTMAIYNFCQRDLATITAITRFYTHPPFISKLTTFI